MRIVSQKYGSADPHQNVTDPQHCIIVSSKLLFRLYINMPVETGPYVTYTMIKMPKFLTIIIFCWMFVLFFHFASGIIYVESSVAYSRLKSEHHHGLIPHCIKSELYLAKWKWILRSGPKLKMLVKFHRSNGSFPNLMNWWRIRFGCTALDKCYWNKENWFANWKSTRHFSDLHILGSSMPLIIEFFIKIKSQFGRFWGQTRKIILSLP